MRDPISAISRYLKQKNQNLINIKRRIMELFHNRRMRKWAISKRVLMKAKKLSRHEISYALAIKFVALGALWFFFVRGHEIVPTPDFIARHLF